MLSGEEARRPSVSFLSLGLFRYNFACINDAYLKILRPKEILSVTLR